MKYKNYLLNLLENIPLWYEDVQSESFSDHYTRPLRSLNRHLKYKLRWVAFATIVDILQPTKEM